MPDKHSLLSPSSAERWLRCPASVELSTHVPEPKSLYADEGTLAHALAAYKLESEDSEHYDELYPKESKRLRTDPLYDADMEEYTGEYVKLVREIIDGYDNPFFIIESVVNLEDIAPDTFGTADCIITGDKTLEVIDFKYGKNVKVSAVNNPQLRLYAFGALQWLKGLNIEIDKVRTHIIQPRMNNYSVEEITSEELETWALEYVKPIAERALNKKNEPMPGEWCRFCPAIAICKNCSQRYDLKIIPDDPRVLSYSEIAQLITEFKRAVKYLKKLEEFASEEIKRGIDIPGYKLVEGRSTRRWNDTDEVIRRADENDIKSVKTEVLSPPKIEKQIGKKRFNELFCDLVEKPKGKPTLVTIEDKREPYK